MKKYRLMFFGSADFSVYVLKSLTKQRKPDLIITLPAKQANRGLKLTLNPVALYALKKKIPFEELISWENFRKEIKILNLDEWLGVVAGFGKIFPQEIISLFKNGILNVHPSLLPKYRGANPIRETILNGDEKTGVTIIFMDELVDHGPIIQQTALPLKGNETYEELEEKLGLLGGKLLIQTIQFLEKAKPQDVEKIKETGKQSDNEATFTRKLEKKDGLLDLSEGYEIWQRKIRALNPWPGTYIYIWLKGEKSMLKIFSIKKMKKNEIPEDLKNLKIGNFFQFRNKLGLRLKDEFILIEELQLASRKKMSSNEFLNGYKLGTFKLA